MYVTFIYKSNTFMQLFIYITGVFDLYLRGKDLPSLEDFQQHSQRIRKLEYDTEIAAADDIVSSMKNNYLVFPANYEDTGYVDDLGYVSKLHNNTSDQGTKSVKIKFSFHYKILVKVNIMNIS